MAERVDTIVVDVGDEARPGVELVVGRVVDPSEEPVGTQSASSGLSAV